MSPLGPKAVFSLAINLIFLQKLPDAALGMVLRIFCLLCHSHFLYVCLKIKADATAAAVAMKERENGMLNMTSFSFPSHAEVAQQSCYLALCCLIGPVFVSEYSQYGEAFTYLISERRIQAFHGLNASWVSGSLLAWP